MIEASCNARSNKVKLATLVSLGLFSPKEDGRKKIAEEDKIRGKGTNEWTLTSSGGKSLKRAGKIEMECGRFMSPFLFFLPKKQKVKDQILGSPHTQRKERDIEESINDGKVPSFKFSFIASIVHHHPIQHKKIFV